MPDRGAALMACCSCDDHDYCCRCYTFEERTERMVADVLDGTYSGEADTPDFLHMPGAYARTAARAILAVLKHENAI
ncbi:hypothetical protein ACFWE3_10915 [Mycobacteriaceae bacterium NPDC060252]